MLQKFAIHKVTNICMCNTIYITREELEILSKKQRSHHQVVLFLQDSKDNDKLLFPILRHLHKHFPYKCFILENFDCFPKVEPYMPSISFRKHSLAAATSFLEQIHQSLELPCGWEIFSNFKIITQLYVLKFSENVFRAEVNAPKKLYLFSRFAC